MVALGARCRCGLPGDTGHHHTGGLSHLEMPQDAHGARVKVEELVSTKTCLGKAGGKQYTLPQEPWDAVTGRARGPLPSVSLSTAFLFLLCLPALQARKPQRAARTRMNPTMAGTPKIRRVLGRFTEGRVGSWAEAGAARVGSAVR